MPVSAVGAAVAAIMLPLAPVVMRYSSSVVLGAHTVVLGSWLALVLVTDTFVLDKTQDSSERLRALHTIKGNAGLFGLNGLSHRCHGLEEQLRQEAEATLCPRQRAQFEAAFQDTESLVAPLLSNDPRDIVAIERAEYEATLTLMASADPSMHARLLSWSWERTGVHLQRLSKQARALSRRRHGVDLRIAIDDDGACFPWADVPAFWHASVHLIRNAIDHGIESPEQRRAVGKPEQGLLTFRARSGRHGVTIEVADDGRGIDWENIRIRATALGLPADSPSPCALASDMLRASAAL